MSDAALATMPNATIYEAHLNRAIDELQTDLEVARTLTSYQVLLLVLAGVLWCIALGCLAAACCILPCYRRWLQLQEPPDTPPDLEMVPPLEEETTDESARGSDDE